MVVLAVGKSLQIVFRKPEMGAVSCEWIFGGQLSRKV